MQHVKQVYTGGSDQQIQNINSQIMENSEPESFQTEKEPVGDRFLKLCRSHYGKENMRQLETNLFQKISFRKKRDAILFSNHATNSSKNIRVYEISREEKTYAVSLRWTGQLNIETRRCQLEIHSLVPVDKKIKCQIVSSDLALPILKSDTYQPHPNQGSEDHILREVKATNAYKDMFGLMTHQSIFSTLQDVKRFEKWVMKNANTFKVTDIIKSDKGYTSHYSLFTDNLPDDLVGCSLRVIRKASEFGGKYLEWNGFVLIDV